ncbi:MAG: prepilin peptidase [Candidatus Latescibacterota bacterium]
MNSVDPYFFPFFVFLFGLCAGSFLNVVIYRLPRRESIAFPASHCPECLTPIRFYDNIPILGFVMLRGKCRRCGVRISPMYPAVEFITGALFLSLFLLRGPTLFFLSDVFLGTLLLAVLFIDLKFMIIPDRLNLAGGTAGLLFALLHGPAGILWAAEGALAGILVLLIMAFLGRLMFRRESMGMGDFKLVTVTGFFLGPMGNFTALVLAIFIGGVWGVFHLAVRKGEAEKEVPFGPFIAAGCWLVLFFREYLMQAAAAYLSIF